MAKRLMDRINTKSLMAIVLYFSYIWDTLRATYYSSSILPTRKVQGGRNKGKPSKNPGDYDDDDLNSIGFGRPRSRESENRFRAPIVFEDDSQMPDSKSEANLSSRPDCPLTKMPIPFRIYFFISTLSHVLNFIKYIAVSLIKYHIIEADEILTCYMPGRVSFLDDLAYEFPGMAIMMVGTHIVWRSMWYFVYNRLELDPLLFIICDDEVVREKEHKLRSVMPKLKPSQRLEAYRTDRMFYQKIRTPSGQIEYILRKDRDLEHKGKLNYLARLVTIIMLMNSIFFGTPLSVIMLFNVMSHDYFDINYNQCRSFAASYSATANLTTGAGRTSESAAAAATAAAAAAAATTMEAQTFRWSFSDPYRLGMFLADGFDNFMVLFDSASGLTWPLVTSTIMAQDLTISMNDIIGRITLIQQYIIDNRLKFTESIRTRASTMSTKDHRHHQQPDLELEITILQSDIMIVFDNVRKADVFINGFAAYAVTIWIAINVSYEVLYVTRRHELVPNTTVLWLQIGALLLLTITFAHLGNTHSKTVELYHKCCNLMAQDPFFRTTKPSWIWLLEYYHQHKSLFSLHMGWDVLTLLNYVKFMLYSITASMVLINLVFYELG